MSGIVIINQEPEAKECIDAILSRNTRLISAMSEIECAAVVLAKHGAASSGALETVPMGHEHVKLARIALLQFGKGRHPAGLNIGDVSSYALAAQKGFPLLFKGIEFSKTDLSKIAV